MPGKKIVDLTGQVFGRLTVLNMRRTRGKTFCRCRCECNTVKDIWSARLKNGETRSCGCLNSDLVIARNFKHGASKRSGAYPLYWIWGNMLDRCYNRNNEKYLDYGGRGITVCEAWHTYVVFRDHMLSLPDCPRNAEVPGALLNRQIDRIDNHKGYHAGNVKWSTRSQQQSNKRSNVIVVVKGNKMTLTEAVYEHSSLQYRTVHKRINSGWTIDAALTTPLQR